MKKLTEEHKRKISQKMKGRKLTEDHKEKIRQALLKRRSLSASEFLPDLYTKF